MSDRQATVKVLKPFFFMHPISVLLVKSRSMCEVVEWWSGE
jgi:hypothetical protein